MSPAFELALGSCLLLGFRHGFDYDHLAALTDITSVQQGWKQGMGLGLLYAVGHAVTVAVLGCTVLLLDVSLPGQLDSVGERLVGVTLIALGVVVLLSLRKGARAHGGSGAPQTTADHPEMRSRLALLVGALSLGLWQLRRLREPTLPRPLSFRFRYNRGSVFLVGVVHGLGAETPSQLLLFLLAAKLGGNSRGLLGLAAFLLGLLAMNTIMTASASGVFAGSLQKPRIRITITTITALYSCAVGTIFLLGLSDKLPALVR